MYSIRALLFALLAIGADASAATIRCDHCSEATYQSKAVTAGLGIHYVYDLPNAQSRKYQVTLECDDNLDDGRTTCTKTAWPLTVESEIVNVTLELAAYYQVTGGTMKTHFTVVANGAVGGFSAFDVAGPGGPMTQLTNWFDSTQAWSIQNTLPFLGASLHQLSVQALGLYNESLGNTFVTIQFPVDGSEITLSYNMSNGTVEAVPGSAKDKFGNVIPASADQLGGLRFDYSREQPNGPAQRGMQAHLSAIGAIFSGTPIRWICIRIGGDKWTCSGT